MTCGTLTNDVATFSNHTPTQEYVKSMFKSTKKTCYAFVYDNGCLCHAHEYTYKHT